MKCLIVVPLASTKWNSKSTVFKQVSRTLLFSSLVKQAGIPTPKITPLVQLLLLCQDILDENPQSYNTLFVLHFITLDYFNIKLDFILVITLKRFYIWHKLSVLVLPVLIFNTYNSRCGVKEGSSSHSPSSSLNLFPSFFNYTFLLWFTERLTFSFPLFSIWFASSVTFPPRHLPFFSLSAALLSFFLLSRSIFPQHPPPPSLALPFQSAR